LERSRDICTDTKADTRTHRPACFDRPANLPRTYTDVSFLRCSSRYLTSSYLAGGYGSGHLGCTRDHPGAFHLPTAYYLSSTSHHLSSTTYHIASTGNNPTDNV
jgi:hypothetical protein